jgi:hypothetical protein
MTEPNRDPTIPQLDSHQRGLVQAVFDTVRKTGRWPSARHLRIQLHRADRTADLEEIARSIPELVSCDPVENENGECRLRLRALFYASGAEQDRENIARAIRTLAIAYVDHEAERMSGAELEQRLELDAMLCDASRSLWSGEDWRFGALTAALRIASISSSSSRSSTASWRLSECFGSDKNVWLTFIEERGIAWLSNSHDREPRDYEDCAA